MRRLSIPLLATAAVAAAGCGASSGHRTPVAGDLVVVRTAMRAGLRPSDDEATLTDERVAVVLVALKAVPTRPHGAAWVDCVRHEATISAYLKRFENLQTCGRNGLHRYNNQDHSMWTALLATLNVLDGAAHDVWSVNTESDYLEEGRVIEGLLDFSAGDAAPVEQVA